jgi:hypothetical protein
MARWDGRRHHERAGGLPVQQELVEDGFEGVDGRDVDLEQEAVLARDAVTLADLGHRAGELADLRELTGPGPYTHPRRDGQPDRGRVDVEAVAADHAGLLQAAVVALPIGAFHAAPAFVDPVALAAGIGVGISSSVIPYVCDQLAMARLWRATYALMVSLLPATATVIGVIVLLQVPSVIEVVGVVLVVAGVAVHRERRTEVAARSRHSFIAGRRRARWLATLIRLPHTSGTQ